MTRLGLQWYCAFACLLCESPFSPSLQVHSYISNHQYVRFSHFPWFSLFRHFPQRPIFQEVWVFFFGAGGVLVPHCSQNCLFRIFKPRFFPNPTHHFLELNGCVFGGGGGGCIRLFLVFPPPHFRLQIFSLTHHFPEVKFLCVCGVLHFCPHFPVKLLCVLGGSAML